MIKEVNESKFYMWRAVVALVFADGRAHDEEKKFLHESFAKLPFTEGQKKTLDSDLTEPKDVNEFFEKISDNADRSQFIYFARLLFWSDGDFHKQEKLILESLKNKTLESADLVKVMKDVDTIAQQFQTKSGNKDFRGILADFVGKILGNS